MLNILDIIDSERPGDILRLLGQSKKLPPPLMALVNIPQCPDHHPEGDVFNHTCHVVDAMSRIVKHRAILGDRRSVLMVSALLHDCGKPATTEWNTSKGKLTAYGHDEAGVPIANDFMEKFCQNIFENFDESLLKVLAIVRRHMVMCDKEFSSKSIRRLARKLLPASLEELLMMFLADCAGRPPRHPDLPPPILEILIPKAKELGLLDNGVFFR